MIARWQPTGPLPGRPYHGPVKRRTWWIIIAGAVTAILLTVLGLATASRAKDFQAAAMKGKDAAAAAASSLSARDASNAIAQFEDAAASFNTAKALLGPESAKGAIRALPWLGAQVGAADDLATIGLEGSLAGKEMAAILRDSETAPGGAKNLSSLLKIGRPHLDAALVSLTVVADRYAQLPDQGLVTPLADAVRSARKILTPLEPVLQRSDSILALERFFLATPRRILLLSQNNAELRPTGGFIGSYGLLTVGPEGLSLERYADVYDLGDPDRALRLPAPEGATMGGTYFKFRDANWWIDYPTSARTLNKFWLDLGQEPVDGIIAVDVVAMRDLLAVFGPITVKEFDTTFTADNLLERLIAIVEVQMGPTGQPRKGVLVLLANELTSRMMAMQADDLLATTAALGNSANDKHLQLYFNDASTQAAVAQAGWAGAIDPPQGTTDLLAVSNAMVRASKANMGVRKTIDYHVALAADGSADTTITLGYSNKDPQVSGILRRWFGNYLRVYRPTGTTALPGPDGTPPSDMVTDETGLPAVARAFRLHRGQSREEVMRTKVPQAVQAGSAAVLPRSPVGLGTAQKPSTPTNGGSHYRLLIVRQADLENVPTTVSVTLPAGWTTSAVSAWKRTTGEALPVSDANGTVTLSTPLDGDVIMDVEMVPPAASR